MVTAIFGPLAAAMAAAIAQLAPRRFWRKPAAAEPRRGDTPAAAPGPEALPGAAAESDQTTGFIFYTLDDAFLPYGPDILHWWFRNPVPRDLQAETKEGDLV